MFQVRNIRDYIESECCQQRSIGNKKQIPIIFLFENLHDKLIAEKWILPGNTLVMGFCTAVLAEKARHLATSR